MTPEERFMGEAPFRSMGKVVDVATQARPSQFNLAAGDQARFAKVDPARFAEAMVLLTLRHAAKNAELIHLARQA